MTNSLKFTDEEFRLHQIELLKPDHILVPPEHRFTFLRGPYNLLQTGIAPIVIGNVLFNVYLHKSV